MSRRLKGVEGHSRKLDFIVSAVRSFWRVLVSSMTWYVIHFLEIGGRGSVTAEKP